jgi:hypothetical protein
MDNEPTGPAHGQPAAQHATIEQPLTETMARYLRRAITRTRWLYIGGAGACIALRLLVASMQMPSPPARVLLGLIAICGTLILLCAAVVTTRDLALDVRAGTYVQTTGHLRVIHEERMGFEAPAHTYYVQLAERQLQISRRTYRALADLSFGTVDYSRSGAVIFDVRDPAGRVVYRETAGCLDDPDAGASVVPAVS